MIYSYSLMTDNGLMIEFYAHNNDEALVRVTEYKKKYEFSEYELILPDDYTPEYMTMHEYRSIKQEFGEYAQSNRIIAMFDNWFKSNDASLNDFLPDKLMPVARIMSVLIDNNLTELPAYGELSKTFIEVMLTLMGIYPSQLSDEEKEQMRKDSYNVIKEVSEEEFEEGDSNE